MEKNLFTYIGLLISFATITGFNLLFKHFYGSQLDDPAAIARELCIFLMVAILFWIILKKEKLTLESIGLYPENFKRSLLWSLFTVLVCGIGLALSIIISQQLGWTFGESMAFDKLSLGTILLIVLRAGIAEEIFFRGYIIERLKALTGKVYFAAGLSLIPFALFHYTQGPAGILISFVLGGIFTGMYLWKRDLKANIIAHFIVDFVPNVLFPLLSGE